METRDVLIVGGGPAGSSLAWGLRDAGLRVAIVDRARFPRDKTCAGWVTPPVFAALGIDPEVYAKGRTCQPIFGFRVQRIGAPEAVARFDTPVSYGIRRCELDHHLLERCEAELRLGEPVRRVERRAGRWVLNGTLEAPLLVGAGGHFCPVARHVAGGSDEPEPIVAAQEVEFELAPGEEGPVDPELPELYFTEDLRGYGWLFRKGRHFNVGLGRQDRERLSEHVGRFLELLRGLGRLPKQVPERMHGHAYLLHGQARRPLVADGLLLVGDAAGMAHPRSGEGIRPAVETGLLAARHIAGLRGFDATSLAGYARDVEARWGPREPGWRPGLTDLLPAPLARALAGRLLGNAWFARHVVVERWFVGGPPGQDEPARSA